MGIIYKITCGELTYYGCSIDESLSYALEQHRCLYTRWKKGSSRHFTTSALLFEKGEEPSIHLVEEVLGLSKRELLICKRRHIENNKCVNKITRSILTDEERKCSEDSAPGGGIEIV